MELFEDFKAEKKAAYYSTLAEQARHDRDAFAELYDYFFPRVYNYIFARVKKYDLADDIVSATFERVLVKLDSFDRSRGAFSTWLFRIAANEISNSFRQQSCSHETTWEEFLDPEDGARTPEQELLAAEGRTELLQALDQLSERERQVVCLKYFSELGNKEIALQLDMTAGNVGVILHRSLEKLKSFLEKA